mmetsp:Transcript_90605/g.272101  ORF Transcript_90605/g.272101 Transcript_90605/m.272101 type:complete len:206 (+) Transcript_90605:397-1014(+)
MAQPPVARSRPASTTPRRIRRTRRTHRTRRPRRIGGFVQRVRRGGGFSVGSLVAVAPGGRGRLAVQRERHRRAAARRRGRAARGRLRSHRVHRGRRARFLRARRLRHRPRRAHRAARHALPPHRRRDARHARPGRPLRGRVHCAARGPAARGDGAPRDGAAALPLARLAAAAHGRAPRALSRGESSLPRRDLLVGYRVLSRTCCL